MVRDSRSPGPSNRSEHLGKDRSPDRPSDYDYRRKSRRDNGYNSRAGRTRGENLESSYRKNGGSSRGHRHDRRGDTQTRRSASPPRNRASRPRSRSRSRPPSGSRSQSPVDKAKPNFAPSGLLAAATKTVKNSDGTSTVLKYHEPPEARKPVIGWRLYVFKGSEQVGELLRVPILPRACFDRGFLDLLHIYRQSAYLFGRDRTVADVTLDHPSCSKQHAVIQCEPSPHHHALRLN